MKIVTIVGARPQFVKAAMVSRPLRRVAREVLVHTGQHYDANMSDVFFQELEIPAPDYHLGVGSGAHGAQTGEMLKRIEEVLLPEAPDIVLVYGDTNSTLAGALAAAKLHVSVAHVEAGLRSFNRRMPEELNRIVTDHVSSLLFAPTDAAVINLEREGISSGVCQVGDVMYDAVLHHLRGATEYSQALERYQLCSGKYVLATLHRAENTGDPQRLQGIMAALGKIAREVQVVFPVHPRTRRVLNATSATKDAGLMMIDPLSYFDMLKLESDAFCIITDSGGVQKEAFFLRTPCVTARDETEWVETVETGWNTLAGSDTDAIVRTVLESKPGALGARPYGTGDAAERIVELLLSGPAKGFEVRRQQTVLSAAAPA